VTFWERTTVVVGTSLLKGQSTPRTSTTISGTCWSGFFLVVTRSPKRRTGGHTSTLLWKSSYLYAGTGPLVDAVSIAGIAALRAGVGFDIYQVNEDAV
jgi:hypothetical protein